MNKYDSVLELIGLMLVYILISVLLFGVFIGGVIFLLINLFF